MSAMGVPEAISKGAIRSRDLTEGSLLQALPGLVVCRFTVSRDC